MTDDDTGTNEEGRDGPAAAGQQPLEDAHIVEHIADHYLANFRYSGGLGWMRYDGCKWGPVPHSEVVNEVRVGLVEFQYAQGLGGANHDYLTKVSRLLSVARIKGIAELAKGYLLVADDAFDQCPDLLNVRNGVVDLRAGELLPHDPELMLTKVTAVDYDPEAEHEDWHKALTALPADTHKWLQIRFGQGLTGHPPPDDVAVVFGGSGSNGKTSVVDPVRKAVGDYGVALGERVLLSHPGDHPTELMPLRGARLAIVEETPELGHLNVKRLKDLQGTDRITARGIGKDSTSWRATHTMFITTNYLPRVDESDHGTWRRLALVNFPFRYCKPWEAIENKGTDLPAELGLRERLRDGGDKQHEAVLAWLVKGALKWYRGNREMPEPPKSVLDATREWRKTADLLLRYADDRLIFAPTAHVMATELYADFCEWLQANGHRKWTDQNFSARLGQHSEMTTVEKKRVRSSLPGLSRREGGDLGERLSKFSSPPAQFHAWTGVRFRTKDDQEADDEALDEANVAAEQGDK